MKCFVPDEQKGCVQTSKLVATQLSQNFSPPRFEYSFSDKKVMNLHASSVSLNFRGAVYEDVQL